MKRLRTIFEISMTDLIAKKYENIFGSTNSVKYNLIVTNRFYSVIFFFFFFFLILEQILRR